MKIYAVIYINVSEINDKIQKANLKIPSENSYFSFNTFQLDNLIPRPTFANICTSS